MPSGVRLVAISKYHPISSILEAYNSGQRLFGENHVQELVSKHDALPTDIEWHFTGHLQRNKVKYIVPFVSLIHSVDSLRLLDEIDRQGGKCGRVIPCLLELHIANEESKYGFLPEELDNLLSSGKLKGYEHVSLRGLMCMATNTDDEEQIEREFGYAKSVFDDLKSRYFADDEGFCELSMGMSDDYSIALRHGSTLIRVGTKIFGNREY